MPEPTTDAMWADVEACDTQGGMQPRRVSLLSTREVDTLGAVTDATRRKAEIILDEVEAAFGLRPATVWGYGPNPEHNNARCLDVMVTDPRDPSGWLGGSRARAQEIGDYVSALVWQRRTAWGLRHVIWRQRILSAYVAPGVWRGLPDRGSLAQNHEDHPHINFAQDSLTPYITEAPTINDAAPAAPAAPAPPVITVHQEDDTMTRIISSPSRAYQLDDTRREIHDISGAGAVAVRATLDAYRGVAYGTDVEVDAVIAVLRDMCGYRDAALVGIVTTAYQAILRRDPDPDGLTHWTAQLAAGMSEADMRARIAASDEYRALHAANRPDDRTPHAR